MVTLLTILCIGCGESSPKEVASNDPTEVSQPGETADPPKVAGNTNGTKAETGGTSMPGQPAGPMGNMEPMKKPDSKDIVFKDNVSTNAEVPENLNELVFVDKDGNRVRLESYLGKKNIVLVFTEGFAGGMLCPFCKTQTARLVGNYDKFQALDTEILVVYPGGTEHLKEFINAATKTEKAQVDRVPFPVVLDQELKAVSFFNISSNLAHPSTFIIDKGGNVQLAYVGADMTSDRPSVSAMLRILKKIQADSDGKQSGS